MEHQRIIEQWQQVTPEDYEAFVADPTRSLDNLAGDAITDEKAFVGFTVAPVGSFEVSIAAGRYWRLGKRYEREEGDLLTISLLSLLPGVTKKVVSIVVWGDEVNTNPQSRSYIDADDETIHSDTAPRERRRIAYIDRVPGQENVDPQAPALDANVLRIANVYMGTGGIERIEMIDANRLVSVKTLNTRLTLVERRLDQAGSQIETLRTDIAGLAALIRTKADRKMVVQMAMDLARVMREAKLPNDYVGWDSDDFRDNWKSKPGHATYAAHVAMGLRFSGASELSALALLNNIDARISVTDSMVSAAWTAKKRLSVTGKDGEIALASYQLDSTDMTQVPISRKSIVYERNPRTGGWDLVKEAYSGGAAFEDDDKPAALIEVLKREQARGLLRTDPDTGILEDPVYITETIQREDGSFVEVRFTVQLRGTTLTAQEAWYAEGPDLTVNGYQSAQNFVNSQSGSLVGLNLFFTRKGATGDVKVVFAECTEAGRPDPNRVLAQATVTAANIVADATGQSPTYFSFAPRQLFKGKRYCWWVVTQGAHWLATVSGDKFAQGSAFVLQNDVWNQLAGDMDLPFELFFAGYSATRIEVPLEPVTLAGGIGFIDINSDVVEPDGTAIIFEGKTSGDWFSIPAPADITNPLLALPASMQLRAVMLGTTDDMPKFGIGSQRSCVQARRAGTSLVHFSEIRTLKAEVDTIEVELKGYGFDSGEASMAVKILRGASYATVETADAVVDLPVIGGSAGVFHKSFLFTLGADTDDYIVKIEGTCTAGNDFVVAERTDVGYDA